MKLQRTTITFERTMTVVVYAPEDMSESVLQTIANDTARSDMRGWDPPDWEVCMGPSTLVEVPASERQLGEPNRYGFRLIASGSRLGREDTTVVNDAHDAFVCVEDATWWIAPPLEVLAEIGGAS